MLPVVIINHLRCAGRFFAGTFKLAVQLQTLLLAGMMIKPQPTTFYIGHIRQNIIFSDGNFVILQVLGMHIEDVIDNSKLFQNCRTDRAVKIRSRQ